MALAKDHHTGGQHMPESAGVDQEITAVERDDAVSFVGLARDRVDDKAVTAIEYR
jgi:molybdopterin synthase catalytic subunit